MKQYKTDVYIVDDHILFNEALTTAINQRENIHVSRTFSTLEACAHALRERRPDVLLLDISMPDGSGIDFCRQMISEYPQMRIVPRRALRHPQGSRCGHPRLCPQDCFGRRTPQCRALRLSR